MQKKYAGIDYEEVVRLFLITSQECALYGRKIHRQQKVVFKIRFWNYTKKGLLLMSVPKDKYKFALWLYPETWDKVNELYLQDNCKSKSEFIEKTIRFYVSHLTADDDTSYLLNALILNLCRIPCRLKFKRHCRQTDLWCINIKRKTKWSDIGVLSILRNEKYKGTHFFKNIKAIQIWMENYSFIVYLTIINLCSNKYYSLRTNVCKKVSVDWLMSLIILNILTIISKNCCIFLIMWCTSIIV